MSAITKIQWTDRTWNPLRGCSRISEGCRNCYAEKVAHRFAGPGLAYAGLTDHNGRWNGRIRSVEKALREPASWKDPQKVFVNSMSDLFHENADERFRCRILNVIGANPRHTFQVLTKRPEIMRQVMRGYYALAGLFGRRHPFENLWLGVSVEDQETAEARIPILLQTPAAVRFVSYEPALGPVDFAQLIEGSPVNSWITWLDEVDWIIVGGESGPGARPCDIEWIRNTVEQCKAAGVACFVKQLGSWPYLSRDNHDWANWPSSTHCDVLDQNDTAIGWVPLLRDRKGGEPAEWPDDLRVREFPK